MKTSPISELAEISQVGLVCLAAQMTAAADLMLTPRRPGPPPELTDKSVVHNRWTMLLYDAMKKRDIDMNFIYRLEQSINQELKHYGHPPVHFSDAFLPRLEIL